MGLIESVADHSERRTMELVAKAIETNGNLEHGPVDLMCHIMPAETHHGIWVGGHGARGSAAGWVGIYRCQGHFWGVVLDRSEIAEIAQRPDALLWRMQNSKLGGRDYKDVTDLGPMKLGVESLVAVLAALDFDHLGDSEDQTRDSSLPENDPTPSEEPFLFNGLFWENNGQIDWETVEADVDVGEDVLDPEDVEYVPSPDLSSLPASYVPASIEEICRLLEPMSWWAPEPTVSRKGFVLELFNPHGSRDGLDLVLRNEGKAWQHEFIIRINERSEQPATQLFSWATFLTSRASAIQVAAQAVGIILGLVRGFQYPLVTESSDYDVLQLTRHFGPSFDKDWVLQTAARAETYLATLLLRADLQTNERSFIEWMIDRDSDLVVNAEYIQEITAEDND